MKLCAMMSESGLTHVLKVAESLAERGNNVLIISGRVSREQKRYEKICEGIFTRLSIDFPVCGKTSSKEGEEKVKFFSLNGKVDENVWNITVIAKARGEG